MSIRRFATLFIIAALIDGAAANAPSAETSARLKQIMRQSRSLPAAAPPAPNDEASMRRRAELLRRGEAALAKADVDAALNAFNEAAAILHAADTEMGLVRTYMQYGEYRRATAFVAHTAQAHREVPGAAALYAWLLYLGGHGANAKRILGEAEAQFPHDVTLALTRSQLDSSAPTASGALLKVPARMAPFGPAPGLPATAFVAGSGLLIDGGSRAIVTLAAIKKSTNLWVRDGLGRFSRGTVERRMDNDAFAIVRLDKAIDLGANIMLAEGTVYPGSAAFVVEYVATKDATPSWPLLSTGFVGRPIAGGVQRQLDVNPHAGARGGAVFNSAGGLVGIAIPGGDGNDLLVPVSQMRDSLGAALGTSTVPPPTTRMPVDQIYELALRRTVQVILAR